MVYLKINAIFKKLIFSHLFFRRFAAHYQSCKISVFIYCIYFSIYNLFTIYFIFTCLAFIFAYTAAVEYFIAGVYVEVLAVIKSFIRIAEIKIL